MVLILVKRSRFRGFRGEFPEGVDFTENAKKVELWFRFLFGVVLWFEGVCSWV